MTHSTPPARAPRRRRLTSEEIDLWLHVVAGVARLPGAVLPERAAPPSPAHRPASKPVPAKPPPTKQQHASAARPQPSAASYTPAPQINLPRPAPLDRRVRQKLSRGQMAADAAIDLHGFRQADAHRALRTFLRDAQRDGARLVLVVTGKGGRRDDPDAMHVPGVGVLKRSVPLWLAEPDLRAIVVGFEDAGRAHGGTGALYVRLRRPG